MHQILCCGYSLELFRRDDSNEYPQHRICKRTQGFKTPSLALSGALQASAYHRDCNNNRMANKDESSVKRELNTPAK